MNQQKLTGKFLTGGQILLSLFFLFAFINFDAFVIFIKKDFSSLVLMIWFIMKNGIL